MFRTVPLSIIRSFHCTHSNGICHTVFVDSCQQACMTYTVAVCTVKTPDDGQRNCPKHVQFHSKNEFEKLVHLVGFIIRIGEFQAPSVRTHVNMLCVAGRSTRSDGSH